MTLKDSHLASHFLRKGFGKRLDIIGNHRHYMKFHVRKFFKQNLKNVFLKKQSFDMRKIKEEHTSYFRK